MQILKKAIILSMSQSPGRRSDAPVMRLLCYTKDRPGVLARAKA